MPLGGSSSGNKPCFAQMSKQLQYALTAAKICGITWEARYVISPFSPTAPRCPYFFAVFLPTRSHFSVPKIVLQALSTSSLVRGVLRRTAYPSKVDLNPFPLASCPSHYGLSFEYLHPLLSFNPAFLDPLFVKRVEMRAFSDVPNGLTPLRNWSRSLTAARLPCVQPLLYQSTDLPGIREIHFFGILARKS